jgi:hypothetical protein
MSNAEYQRRHREKHRDRINAARRKPLVVAHHEGQHVRITQIDGKLPNMALMKLSAWHKARGDHVHLSRSPYRSPTEPEYAAVYGSAIFSYSASRVARFKQEFPDAIVGGTHDRSNTTTVEAVTGDFEGLDYSLWPDFTASLGFTQRGCRLRCGFCVVPKKEGKPRSVSTIADIWRGKPWPKHLHLLDNDFFGQPEEQWRERVDEIRRGGFKVCFNQGINVRAITPEAAAALASVQYADDQFKQRRLYCAWDNLGDEAAFFRGIETLERAGVPPSHVMAYMLVGYDRRETWERVLYRFHRMADWGIRPFPMVYDRSRVLAPGNVEGDFSGKTLTQFQRWAVRRLYTVIPFAEYEPGMRAA